MLNNFELINYLYENYPIKTKSEILAELNLSWSYIQKIACINKIKKGRNESINDNKYIKLIDYTDNISLYWIGFIIADGHIYRSNNIQINISIKDKDYLLNIINHIGNIPFTTSKGVIRMTISDRPTVNKLSNDFRLLSI